MPIIQSSYKPPFLLRNAHAATIYPSMFRKVENVAYKRERIPTRDDDFLDIDWIKNGSGKLIILSHGLEGSTHRPYMIGAANRFSKLGWDVLAWNCRSCSGEMNNKPQFYHHGASNDLEDVVLHSLKANAYKEVYLGGFSLGGSLTVKYLGEHDLPDVIKGGAVFSVPFSILGSVNQLSLRGNGFYRKRFLKKLKIKILEKSKTFPDQISIEGLDAIDTFEEFDDKYTAPLHGFEDANDFYRVASAGNYLAGVSLPLLIVNAENDPFLSENCYPKEISRDSKNITLEIPEMGGHVGFLTSKDRSWIDDRMVAFIDHLEN